jgi:hypothetical protein
MRLLSVGEAKSIWLFDINELNPAGKQLFPEALIWLGEKYSFQTFPKTIAGTENSGFHFKQGQFQTEEGHSYPANFSIHGDGLVVETWASTEIGDRFLAEILRLASARYGLEFKFESVAKKLYISELTVQFDDDLSKFNEQFTGFCEQLDAIMVRHRLPKYELTGMIFSPDTSDTSYKPPGFMLERKNNAPFQANKYWSKSPFTTSDHLKALEAYEDLLKGLK